MQVDFRDEDESVGELGQVGFPTAEEFEPWGGVVWGRHGGFEIGIAEPRGADPEWGLGWGLIFAAEGAAESAIEETFGGLLRVRGREVELLCDGIEEGGVSEGDTESFAVPFGVDPRGELALGQVVAMEAELGWVGGGDDGEFGDGLFEDGAIEGEDGEAIPLPAPEADEHFGEAEDIGASAAETEWESIEVAGEGPCAEVGRGFFEHAKGLDEPFGFGDFGGREVFETEEEDMVRGGVAAVFRTGHMDLQIGHIIFGELNLLFDRWAEEGG